MALKTTIGPKGVVTENVAGSQDELVVNVNRAREDVRTVVSASGTVNLDLDTTTLLVAPAAAGVTCSLPGLSSANEGQMVTLMHDANGETVLVSGSNNINGSATLAYGQAYGVLKLMGVKADNDGNWLWQIVEQKGTA